MKKTLLILASLAFAFASCNDSEAGSAVSQQPSTTTEQTSAEPKEVSNDNVAAEAPAKEESPKEAPKTEQKAEQKADHKWNYSGTINNKYKIKAYIDWVESENGMSLFVKGYYYYESTKIKIPLEGGSYGMGGLRMIATTADGEEEFDGEYEYMAGPIKGKWKSGGKSFPFVLNPKK